MTTPRTDLPSLAAKESESDKLAARIDPAGVSTLPDTSAPAPAPNVTTSSPTHTASTAHEMEHEQAEKDDEAAESISKLATGFGGVRCRGSDVLVCSPSRKLADSSQLAKRYR